MGEMRTLPLTIGGASAIADYRARGDRTAALHEIQDKPSLCRVVSRLASLRK